MNCKKDRKERVKMKNNLIKKSISGLMALSLLIPSSTNLAVSAEEPEKFQYTMFGRNGITMSVSSNLCMNGNLHTNKDAAITATNKNINGKVTTSADIEKRVKHVYSDQKIYDTYFTTNCELHEEEYVYSDMNIHINNPLYCYSNITLDGNVSLNSSLGTLMDINVTGEVKNANNSVVYSKYGNITIENDSTANVNGLIYAPLGTVTINSPNVTINGIIIADRVVINGSSVNINCNDSIARFIGETSEEYDFSGLEYLPEEWLGDTDADALFDIYEKVIDSDPFNPDTDGDGLPDGYEVLTLNTDPLEIDTDGNGVLDGNEDFDTDNLVNIDEYHNQTRPFIPDTDEDGFVDGDEVHIYGTIPTNPDTDADKLLDGEESFDGTIYLEYGVYFDPLNPDTDGDGIADGDEVFGQTKEQEVQTQDEAITEVIVDMETKGNIDRTLTVESMQGIDAMTSNVYALVGEPFNFETESDFESATITFKIDQSKLGDTQFDKLLILWYNEEKQIFEEMPTTHDAVNSTVSTTTTHFSQYMVVDSEKWFEQWENSFRQMDDACGDDTVVEYPLHTYFLIDCSKEMADVDPSNQRKTICRNIIDNMQSFDKASVATFSKGIDFDSNLTSSKSTLKSYLEQIDNNGTYTNVAAALGPTLTEIDDTIPDKPYRIIILTHGNADFGPVKMAMSQFDNQFENGTVNVINLSSSVMSEDAISFAKNSGGDVYYAAEATELTTQVGSAITYPAPFDNTDSDGDGIPDIVELYGLKPDGTPINSDPNKEDTDGDDINDNEELGYVPFDAILYSSVEYLTHFYYRSDPFERDTDKDGLEDSCDAIPKNTYNNGEFIELSNIEIEMLQKWLVKLGYLDMKDNPYGKSYGILTKTAVNVYQLNHGFALTEQIDSNTYATIANEYAIKFGNGISDYRIISNINKPFFVTIPLIKPILSDEYIDLGISVSLEDNSAFKSDYDYEGNSVDVIPMYLFDYTLPINQMIDRNAQECFKYSADDLYTYWWFFWRVNNGEEWDIKLENRWNEQMPGVNQYSKHFPFKFRELVITAEELGNITYGYWGTCFNCDFDLLLIGGDFASGQIDSEEDKNAIKLGNLYYCIDYNDYTRAFVY